MTTDSIIEQAARAIESQIPMPPPRHADVDPQSEQRTAEFRRGMQYAANIVRALAHQDPVTEDEWRLRWAPGFAVGASGPPYTMCESEENARRLLIRGNGSFEAIESRTVTEWKEVTL